MFDTRLYTAVTVLEVDIFSMSAEPESIFSGTKTQSEIIARR